MSISETAMKNHEALFPNRKSTLIVTDPELIEVFDNFAFDEVLGYGNLDTRTRLMVILASMIACQAVAEYKVMLGGALNVGVTPVEVKEIVYQAVPYVGMAKVYDFIHATNEILESRGIPLPVEGQSNFAAIEPQEGEPLGDMGHEAHVRPFVSELGGIDADEPDLALASVREPDLDRVAVIDDRDGRGDGRVLGFSIPSRQGGRAGGQE